MSEYSVLSKLNTSSGSAKATLKKIPITKIHLNILNPETDTDEEIEAFAETLREEGGVKMPLVVYLDDNGKYILLSGAKRLKATRFNLINHPDQAEYELPCFICERPENKTHEILDLFMYNEHRPRTDAKCKELVQMLLPVYESLLAEQSMKKQKGDPFVPVGTKRKWVAKRLCIGEKKAEKFIHEIEGHHQKKDQKKSIQMHYTALDTQLMQKLQTGVKVSKTKIMIEYNSEDDLNRILQVVGLLES